MRDLELIDSRGGAAELYSKHASKLAAYRYTTVSIMLPSSNLNILLRVCFPTLRLV